MPILMPPKKTRRQKRKEARKADRTSYDRAFTSAFGSKRERSSLGKVVLSLQKDVDALPAYRRPQARRDARDARQARSLQSD